MQIVRVISELVTQWVAKIQRAMESDVNDSTTQPLYKAQGLWGVHLKATSFHHNQQGPNTLTHNEFMLPLLRLGWLEVRS
jgi:hypothetical protein